MSAVLAPVNADETVDAVKSALKLETSLRIEGSGTKASLGRPVHADSVLRLSAMNKILLYEPEELVLSVEAGVLVEEIEALLAAKKQMLAFEPPNYARLFGASGAGTVGGAVACGLSGPRRFKAGALRDFVLGIEGVSGRGERFKSGGRVVKNVTGYDLSKLMTGSFGTLAALTEITLKVLPEKPFEITLIVSCDSAAAAIRLLTKAAQSPFEPSGLAYMPESVNGDPHIAIRIAGSRTAIEYRADALRSLLEVAEENSMPTDQSREYWRDVRDIAPVMNSDKPLWKAVIPPADAPGFIERNDPERYFLDWAGGLVWMTMKEEEALPVLESGALYLIKAPESFRERAPVFPPLPSALHTLSKRVKKSFDPAGILNPGRMYSDF